MIKQSGQSMEQGTYASLRLERKPLSWKASVSLVSSTQVTGTDRRHVTRDPTPST